MKDPGNNVKTCKSLCWFFVVVYLNPMMLIWNNIKRLAGPRTTDSRTGRTRRKASNGSTLCCWGATGLMSTKIEGTRALLATPLRYAGPRKLLTNENSLKAACSTTQPIIWRLLGGCHGIRALHRNPTPAHWMLSIAFGCRVGGVGDLLRHQVASQIVL